MPTVYQHPGVYINEVPGGSKPIEGVGTSTAAFIGFSPSGPANKPTRVTSWLEFSRVFGDPDVKTGPYLKHAYLAHAVNGFFANGGGACYIVRLGTDDYGRVPQIAVESTAEGTPDLFKFVRRSLLRDKDGKLQMGKDGKPQALLHPDPRNDRERASTITVTIAADDPDGAAKAAKAEADAQKAADDARATATADRIAADQAEADAQAPGVADPDKAAQAATTAKRKAASSEDAAEQADATLRGAAAPIPTYTVTVTDDAGGDAASKDYTQRYASVTIVPGPKYLPQVVNGDSQRLVDVMDLGATLTTSARKLDPAQLGGATGKALALAGVPDPDLGATPDGTADDLKGDPVHGTGIEGLAGIDEITMVCVPDLMAIQPTEPEIRDVQAKIDAFCSSGPIKRMAILDPPPGLNKQDIQEWRDAPATPSSNFAVLYWPWLEVTDPFSDQTMFIPPCGHMAGVWAGTDNDRGVHKAPANVAVKATIGVASEITDGDQDALNPEGINCIRTFPGAGIRVWGARTLSNDPEWRYINVRRLFNYVSASILKGTQWAVFEPNDEFLWGQLRVSVGNFLTDTWRGGALFGSTPDQAFFVKCDSETNPQSLIDSGQVNIQIGIAPVKPAEFVVFQIAQYTAAA